MIEKEIEQVKAAKLSCYKYGFISKSGFACTRRADTILIELGELFLEKCKFARFFVEIDVNFNINFDETVWSGM